MIFNGLGGKRAHPTVSDHRNIEEFTNALPAFDMGVFRRERKVRRKVGGPPAASLTGRLYADFL